MAQIPAKMFLVQRCSHMWLLLVTNLSLPCMRQTKNQVVWGAIKGGCDVTIILQIATSSIKWHLTKNKIVFLNDLVNLASFLWGFHHGKF